MGNMWEYDDVMMDVEDLQEGGRGVMKEEEEEEEWWV